MSHEFTNWTQTLLSNDLPLSRYSILQVSLIHVLPSIGTYAFTTPNLANKLMETRKWRVWLTHLNNRWSVLQSWQGQGMTQEYILYFLVLDYSHSCLVQPNSLARIESMKRTPEKTVLSFPHTYVEQLPTSTLWSNPSTNLNWQTAWEGVQIYRRVDTPDPDHCQMLSSYNATICTALPHLNVIFNKMLWVSWSHMG